MSYGRVGTTRERVTGRTCEKQTEQKEKQNGNQEIDEASEEAKQAVQDQDIEAKLLISSQVQEGGGRAVWPLSILLLQTFFTDELTIDGRNTGA